jgi:hypothetical protein
MNTRLAAATRNNRGVASLARNVAMIVGTRYTSPSHA